MTGLLLLVVFYTGDLAAAIRNYSDIHFGVYYSLYEWFNPLWLEDVANKFETQYYVEVSVQVYYMSSIQTTVWINIEVLSSVITLKIKCTPLDIPV